MRRGAPERQTDGIGENDQLDVTYRQVMLARVENIFGLRYNIRVDRPNLQSAGAMVAFLLQAQMAILLVTLAN